MKKIKNSQHYYYYDIILAFFVAILVISNIVAVKLVSFGTIITDGGAIIFPLSYIIGDIMTEIYGYSAARRAIWISAITLVFSSFIFIGVGELPAAEEWNNQEAYKLILGFVPRIVIASIVAFIFGQFINSFVLAKLKIRTEGKLLWLRLILSTIAGELFDTTIFALVAFGSILSVNTLLRYILIGWIFKTVVEIFVVPITYFCVNKLKQAENKDAYDKEISFSPFTLKI